MESAFANRVPPGWGGLGLRCLSTMLVRPSEYVRPVNGPYSFGLRPVGGHGFTPRLPAVGESTTVTETEARVLQPEAASRLAARVHRWTGPEDVDAQGGHPYQGAQLRFLEAAWAERLAFSDVETVLRGTAVVMRSSTTVDFLLRDHHMLDVVLHHYATTGALPSDVLHVDRHSDWCDDRFLLHRNPPQAATWWALLPGLKRPDGRPVLGEADIHFVTAHAQVPGMSGRNVNASMRVPGFLDPARLGWLDAVDRLDGAMPGWVSLDLDCFQPLPQWRLMRALVVDGRFHAILARAKVRVFCLSPQFTNGGDVHQEWTVQGHLHTTLRLVNLLRRPLSDEEPDAR